MSHGEGSSLPRQVFLTLVNMNLMGTAELSTEEKLNISNVSLSSAFLVAKSRVHLSIRIAASPSQAR